MNIQEDFYLSLVLKKAEIAKIKLGLQTYIVGRNQNIDSYLEENFICLNYSFISRFHCSLIMFTCDDDGTSYYKIWDGIPLEKPSKLGTFVNHKKVSTTRLHSGDVITFADSGLNESVPRLIFIESKIDLAQEEETSAHEIS